MVIHENALDATLIMFPNGNTWEPFGCNPHYVPIANTESHVVKKMQTTIFCADSGSRYSSVHVFVKAKSSSTVDTTVPIAGSYWLSTVDGVHIALAKT